MARQVIDTTTNNGTYIGDPAKTAFEKTNDNFSELYSGIAQLSTYVGGLRLEWVSATSIAVQSGAAFIQSLGRIIQLPSRTVKSGVAIGASAWGHVYLYLNGASADIEVSTTAPDSPYSGMSRSKTGDQSRRYLGSIRSDASGNIYNFYHDNNSIFYRVNIFPAPFQVLSGGNSTSPATVNCDQVVPVTSKVAMAMVTNSDASSRVDFSNSESSGPIAFISGSNSDAVMILTNVSRQFTYTYASAPTGSCNCRISGYVFER